MLPLDQSLEPHERFIFICVRATASFLILPVRGDAFFRNEVTADVLFATGQGVAPWMASFTFGGPDLRTVYIGSLKGKRIPYFRAPVAGLPMVHWQERL